MGEMTYMMLYSEKVDRYFTLIIHLVRYGLWLSGRVS